MPPSGEAGERLRELASGRLSTLLLKYSWPALVSMSLNALYAVVDRFYIGRGCGEAAMAGLTLTLPVITLFAAFGVFVGMGHAAALSIKLGEGDRASCERLLGQMVAFKLAFFCILPPLVWFNVDAVLGWCGGAKVSAEAYACARGYLRTVLFSHVFSHLAFGCSAMMRAEGAALASMTCMIVGFGANLVLDPVFIFGLGLGVAGAAWATNIAMAASCAWALSYYLRGRSAVPLRLSCVRFWPGLVAKPCGIGLAPFLQQTFASLINVALPAAFAKWAADAASATTQIASLGVFQSAMILLLMPVLGAQQGIQPVIGYNWGARNFRRVRDAYVAGFWLTTALCVAACVLQSVPPFPRLVARLFVAPDNPELLKIATHDLILSNCMLWCIGFNIVTTTYFQAIGHPAAAIVLSTLRQGVVMLPVIWFLPYFMADKPFAVWLSMPVSDVLCCLMTIVPAALHLRFLSRVRDRVGTVRRNPPAPNSAGTLPNSAGTVPSCPGDNC